MAFADLDYRDKTPRSKAFDDIYFSPEDGIAESDYHFLQGNHLNERFTALSHQCGQTFTVAETGFGTGLNFLLTAGLWQRSQTKPSANNALHYISVEKYPIAPAELNEIYRQNGWDDAIAKDFLSRYSQLLETGQAQFDWPNTRVELTLYLGDAENTYSQRQFSTDAWFLDGFAPRKNPDMWTPALFSAMAKNSRLGATFATFTAASAVRKNLQSVGFCVSKTKGFGNKRERLVGVYQPGKR